MPAIFCIHFFGGLFPLPPPEGLPVVLGPFTGRSTFFSIIFFLSLKLIPLYSTSIHFVTKDSFL